MLAAMTKKGLSKHSRRTNLHILRITGMSPTKGKETPTTK